MSNNSTIPPPFSWSPSQAWDGVDGSWSSFVVRAGTPERSFRILPSTAGRATWLPLPGACRPQDPETCGSSRGTFMTQDGEFGYNFNKSSTWKHIGQFELKLEEHLGYTGGGPFGFDTVGLQIANSGGITLENQIVAAYVTQRYWNGIFGLDIRPSNFSEFEFPQPSFMQTIWDQRIIPSLSYAYTAGASYKIPKVLGSLTLGGYDAARLDSSSGASFPFYEDDSRSLSLGIQSIQTSGTLSANKSTQYLMRSSIFSFIDSTIPHIWLPREVCDSFQESFGLTYDNRTGFYLVNDTIHGRLKDLNPTLSFALGNTNNPSELLNIKLPYAALDLQAQWPIFNKTTNYFPIRRADNDTQYTLGRTFLQEAYVITDYERKNFSVYQAHFEEGATPKADIVSIISPTYPNQNITVSNSTISAPANTKLAGPAIAGITIGTIAGVALIILLALFFLRRRRSRNAAAEGSRVNDDPAAKHATGVHEMWHAPSEVVGDKVQYEMDSKALHMMSDDGVVKYAHTGGVYEMSADGSRSQGPSSRPSSEQGIIEKYRRENSS